MTLVDCLVVERLGGLHKGGCRKKQCSVGLRWDLKKVVESPTRDFTTFAPLRDDTTSLVPYLTLSSPLLPSCFSWSHLTHTYTMTGLK